MRVIAGKFRGLHLEAVKGANTRPTTDKVKEAMFSMLMPYLSGGQVLDLYAGTGGLGIEAVSRGMDHVSLVDRNFQAIQVITNNVAKLHAPDLFTIIKAPAKVALGRLAQAGKQFDLILMDPPYAKETIADDLAAMADQNLLNSEAIILVESDQAAQLPLDSDNFQLLKQKQYGITYVTLYQYLNHK
ncbi:16S rRNA (guanine(966)-N(2))-methyltransferase RsmD [Convivina intestini]|uniref:16S rRNA (Guanine966-N2)-methyltransferase n=1 Tax=Convivina intestini TaxID=1505726 RepID=A0A2U1DC95_9LACO|nr:16S rRNA (guanine(966)-N(2))-methyltransferase RsmD [Convivina intestini]PVY85313.1 16S rRNA (guanine966-N2)-methyltransferase [Convivina intestini]CAH1852832.1 Ribosomal RNA small subunit methyltransferase D [Convivina intestini]SDB86433.1 16S rRNA (guanine966-N2)-methyltransferase [Leuconostocaceae bacterium R-53105]